MSCSTGADNHRSPALQSAGDRSPISRGTGTGSNGRFRHVLLAFMQTTRARSKRSAAFSSHGPAAKVRLCHAAAGEAGSTEGLRDGGMPVLLALATQATSEYPAKEHCGGSSHGVAVARDYGAPAQTTTPLVSCRWAGR